MVAGIEGSVSAPLAALVPAPASGAAVAAATAHILMAAAMAAARKNAVVVGGFISLVRKGERAILPRSAISPARNCKATLRFEGAVRLSLALRAHSCDTVRLSIAGKWLWTRRPSQQE